MLTLVSATHNADCSDRSKGPQDVQDVRIRFDRCQQVSHGLLDDLQICQSIVRKERGNILSVRAHSVKREHLVSYIARLAASESTQERAQGFRDLVSTIAVSLRWHEAQYSASMRVKSDTKSSWRELQSKCRDGIIANTYDG